MGPLDAFHALAYEDVVALTSAVNAVYLSPHSTGIPPPAGMICEFRKHSGPKGQV